MKRTWLLLGLVFLLIPVTAMATTFWVSDYSDDGTSTVPNTLRWAIANANTITAGAPHTIAFSVSNSITVCAPLVISRDATVMDGSSNTLGAIATGIDILRIDANHCTLRNLALVRGHYGVYLTGNANWVLGCRSGVDWADAARGNQVGICVEGDGNSIGGGSAADRNIISGNGTYGVLLDSADNNWVQGNFIGTNGAGTAAVPNSLGIVLGDARANRVGSVTSLSEGNLISGNNNEGIFIYSHGADGGNTICGNVIGLNGTQTGALPNNTGVYLLLAPANWIGLAAGNFYNVIAGNAYYGIYIYGSSTPGGCNVVQNNYVGINSDGAAFGNSSHGIYMQGTHSNLIGGNRQAGAHEKNVIGSNGATGIYLSEGRGNTLCGNYVGVGPDGSSARGNGSGVWVVGSHFNLLGGPNNGTDQRGNVIASNTSPSLYLDQSSGNTLAGNYIGVTADGNQAAANTGEPLQLSQSHWNLIGSPDASWKNVIVGLNGRYGIFLESSSGNTLAGNWIGLLANGSVPAGATYRLGTGIYSTGSSYGNSIGLKNGNGNTVANIINYGIAVDGNDRQGLFGNLITGFDPASLAKRINLISGGNALHSAPAIQWAEAGTVSGQAASGDYVEIFKAERGTAFQGGSLLYLGAATANGTGSWSAAVGGVSNGDYVCALATDANHNTSEFSQNYLYAPQPSRTATPTSTASPTPTITQTVTVSPTPTISATITQTVTASPTLTISATVTQTVTASPTLTMTPTWLNTLLPGDMRAFPNPARNRMRFLLSPELAGEVRISLYNPIGERVAELRGHLPMESGELTWECGAVAPGIYLARVSVNGEEQKKIKVAVIR